MVLSTLSYSFALLFGLSLAGSLWYLTIRDDVPMAVAWFAFGTGSGLYYVVWGTASGGLGTTILATIGVVTGGSIMMYRFSGPGKTPGQ